MTKRIASGLFFLFLLAGLSCTDYTPKPRGYYHIELPEASYRALPLSELPYTFHLSHLAVVELPPVGDPSGWINLSYPALRAKLYCSYLPVTPTTFRQTDNECRSLVARQAKNLNAVKEQEYSNPDKRVYGSLFLLDGGAASPVQFMLTDSVSRFFRGTLYFDCPPNVDSLAPVTDYLRKDIIELMQSFYWTKK